MGSVDLGKRSPGLKGVAVACATGGFKGIFLHGVLSALEAAGFRADAYLAASSSVLPAAAAVAGQANELGLAFWNNGLGAIQTPGTGMSGMILAGIMQYAPQLRPDLFRPDAPRFAIAASAVDEGGAIATQGKDARRLGRRLLLAAARGDRSWVDSHLTLQLFDTASKDPALRLTAENLDEVAYASSRMLHAWDIPAWIGKRPFVDAFYTCACPAMEAAELGYVKVLALANEPILYRDIFQRQPIPEQWHNATIHIVAPDSDPSMSGVDYTTASESGLANIYRHGLEKGRAFLQTCADGDGRL